ncbi:flagellar biosynthetic protein FliR [Shewanella sp. OPT22]|nr:flagellar biosynthetic protein FliR [Shewanella sp. OPT22]
MLALTTDQIVSFLGLFWWPFCRIMGAFALMPMLGSSYIPVTVRILLAASISGILVPVLPAMPTIDPLSIQGVLVAGEQMLVGAMMALFVNMLIVTMTMIGAMMAMQMGLAMAMMNDPSSGSSNPIIGQWLLIYAILLFLSLDGHLVSIGIMVDSFHLWPVGSGVLGLPLMSLVSKFGWMFASAFMVALPVIIAMLLVNITFGVLSRAAPSLNVFALGFPMSMLMGLFCVLFSFSGLPSRYSDFCIEALQSMQNFIGGS